jgi:outer membrane receptor protein involved in Fe transport
VANSGLVPEESISSDGGLFLEFTDKAYAEALYFEQNVRNDIVAIADPANTSLFKFQNVFRTRSTGWEAALNLRLGGGLAFDLSWTQMKAVILENDLLDPRDNWNRVPGVPERQGSASASWRREQWRIYLNMRYSDRRFIDTANSRFLKSYLLMDAGWGFPFAHGFSGSVEGKNLTNETYAELENFPPPGRQVFFTLRWRFPAAGGELEKQDDAPGLKKSSGQILGGRQEP